MAPGIPPARTAVAGVAVAAALEIARGPAWAGASAYDIETLLRQSSPQAVPASATRSDPPAAAPAAAVPAPTTAATQSAPAESRPGDPYHEGWYVSPGIGVVVARDSDNRGNIDISTEFAAGVTFTGAVGYAWPNGIRVEGSLLYQRFPVETAVVKSAGDISGVNVGTTAASGDASALLIMANLGYDFDTGTEFVPYVVGGAGLIRFSYNDVETQGVLILNDQTWQLAFQFGIGTAYRLTERWSADVGYRALFSLQPTLRDAADDKVDTEFLTHNFILGARYAF